MKWHPDSRDKAKTSLWEPTKQTETFWRRQIQREVSDWHYEHMEDKTEWVPDSEDPTLGDWKFVIPPAIEDGTSDTFSAPDGKGEWLNQHSNDPSDLPASVPWDHPGTLKTVPQYDNDVSDANEDAWAAETVKELDELAVLRNRTCFGLTVYLQGPLEWRKRSVRTDLQRFWDTFDFGATWWHPFKTPDPGRWEPMPREYTFFSMHTGAIPKFTPTRWEDPTPKPAGWGPFISKDPLATHGGKQQPHVPGPMPDTQPVPMPWKNPDPEKVAAWADLFEGEQPDHLSTYLKRLLFMNDYIMTDPFRDSPVLPYAMKDTDGKDVEIDRHTRRVRLTASCGHRYAKSIEIMDHRIVQKLVTEERATWERDEEGRLVCLVEEQDADYQLDIWRAGEDELPIRGVRFGLAHWQTKRNYGITFRPKINLRWEIRRRDRKWDFRPEKVPGYKLHCSAQSIMAITGCSRATAFRWIEKFMADQPEPEPWTPAVRPAPDPGANRGLVTLPGQTFHWGGLLGATRMARYGQSTIPARWGNVRIKILLHIQLHNLSQTHPNCPKCGSPRYT